MPRANFNRSVSYSETFADIYRGRAAYDGGAAQNQVFEAEQDAADADLYDRWQNDEVSDEEWLNYIKVRMSASTDPRERQKWQELERDVDRKNKADAKIQQQADDSDAYDRWQNGESTDDEWLGYLAKRVTDTSGDEDPREHQQWVERQRQYQRSIGDKQIELQYQSGAISAAQYIAYHEKVLAGMVSGSQAHAERKAFVTAALDREAANDLQTRSQEIIDRIPSGDASYDDLLKLYQEHLKKARPNSDLFKSLTSEIAKVRGTINENHASGALERIEYLFKAGKMSGSEAGKQIRAVADQYFKGDESRYYNVLESALSFEKYGGGTISSGASGGGGGRRSGGGGSGGSGGTTPRTTVAQLRANIARIENITTQFASGGEITDPLDGSPIANDPKIVHSIQLQGLESYDQLAAIYHAAGKPKEEQNALKSKSTFIKNKVQPLNTISVATQAQQLIGTHIGLINATAASSNDPLDVLRQMQLAGSEIEQFVKESTNKTVNRPVNPNSDLMATGAGMSLRSDPGGGRVKSSEEQATESFISEIAAWGNLFTVLGDPSTTPDDAAILVDTLQKNTGKVLDDSSLTPIVNMAGQYKAAHAGLMSGELVLGTYEVNGKTVVGPIPQRQTTVPPATPDQPWTTGMEPALEYDAQKGEKIVPYYVDINGKPTQAYTTARPVASPYQAWQAKQQLEIEMPDGSIVTVPRGAWIDSSMIGRSTKTTGSQSNPEPGIPWDALVSAGLVQKENYNLGWLAAVMPEHTDQGKTYKSQVVVLDPNLGSWSVGRPPINSVRQNPDGTLWVGDRGKGRIEPEVHYKPNGTKANVPMPYIGDHPQYMQQIHNQLGVGAGTSMIVDETGTLVPAPADYWTDSYYDPALAQMARSVAARRNVTSGGLDDNWFDHSVADAKVRKAKEEAQALARSLVSQRDKDNRFAPPDQWTGLAAMAQQFGINLNTGAPAQRAEDALAIGLPPAPGSTPAVTPLKTTLPPIKAPTNVADFGSVPPPSPPLPKVAAPKVSLPSVPKPTAAPKVGVPPPAPSKTLPSQDVIGSGYKPPAPKPTTQTKVLPGGRVAY